MVIKQLQASFLITGLCTSTVLVHLIPMMTDRGMTIKEAILKGFKPILAGRSEAAIKPLANENSLDYRVFNLDNIKGIEQNLKGIFLVIHCAGPFSSTAKPMMQGCLASKTHYTDITGEIGVFSTRLAFVSVEQNADGSKRFALQVSDSDGEEIIYDLKRNKYFNVGMYLNGKSWVKDVRIVRLH